MQPTALSRENCATGQNGGGGDGGASVCTCASVAPVMRRTLDFVAVDLRAVFVPGPKEVIFSFTSGLATVSTTGQHDKKGANFKTVLKNCAKTLNIISLHLKK
jgi:hypothetical protein